MFGCGGGGDTDSSGSAGGITNTLTMSKSTYKPNEKISANISANLTGNKDWVGIYPKASNNDWENVIIWNWATNGAVSFDLVKKGDGNLAPGEYEARLFFNNTYDDKAKVAFKVSSETSPLTMSKSTYKPNEKISVTISADLTGNKDWVGIYPKASNNDWKNVIIWNWATNGAVSFDLVNKGNGKLAPGEYEARLFFNNTYDDKAKVAFKVAGKVDFAAYGQYEYLNIQGEAVEGIPYRQLRIYKPKLNGVVRKKAPVVIFSTGGFNSNNLSKYEDFIKFIVSKGYFVIGVETGGARDEEIDRIVTTLNKQGDLIDKSKIGLLGNSTGGGTPFYNLTHLKDKNYADTSFIISLDGWFALGLRTDDVKKLNTTTLLLQFGGADGLDYYGHDTGDRHYQDPRILMSLYNILPGNEKSLSYLDNHEHSYPAQSMKNKDDLLRVVGAMLAYKFENGGQTAKDIVLNNNKYDEIKKKAVAVDQYHYGCDDSGYNYCDVNNPTQNF